MSSVLKVVKFINPMIGGVAELALNMTEKVSKKSEKENEMDIALKKAKESQELAIAKRIESAKEVEIEEYYGADTGADVGGSFDSVTNSGSVNVGAKHKKVSKRVIKFKE